MSHFQHCPQKIKQLILAQKHSGFDVLNMRIEHASSFWYLWHLSPFSPSRLGKPAARADMHVIMKYSEIPRFRREQARQQRVSFRYIVHTSDTSTEEKE